MNQGLLESNSEVREHSANRKPAAEIAKLDRRSLSDPMRLSSDILKKLDHYFSTRGLTYLSGQRELLSNAVDAILQAVPGTATAIPFQPGIGKSTMLRALLCIMAVQFLKMTPVAQAVGGIIAVVERTAEAEELETLCNQSSSTQMIARAISSPNDYNLSQGRCLNGTATIYADCPRRRCADYAECPLMQSAKKIHDTPILIMLHARYQQYMENLDPFLTWEDEAGEHRRTLLLIDELPTLIEDSRIDLETINQIESNLSQYKPSYQLQFRKEKSTLLAAWNQSIRIPFFKLRTVTQKSSAMYGIINQNEMDSAGFTSEKLSALRELISAYLGAADHEALRLIDALMSGGSIYYAVGQDISLFMPRVRAIHGEGMPATFLFSGTASLSPELFRNPNIISFPDQNLESFQHLRINVQRGDFFNTSRSGLEGQKNLSGVVAWLKFILPQLIPHHRKILVVTYKKLSKYLWSMLSDFHDHLIPYIDSEGQPQLQLPYYGGMNGSNLYREATCTLCIGLNRFEPRDYISRVLALDFDRIYGTEVDRYLSEQDVRLQLSTIPSVMDMQDITLARDIVQLVFRSALRNHGETRPIELWLLQPPNGVIFYLQQYFQDCRIQEYTELPESCRMAVVSNRTYNNSQTCAGRLLNYLSRWNSKEALTPNKIRSETGLTPNQFKEAKKNIEVRRYFAEHIETRGSGQNTVYQFKQTGPPPNPAAT